MPIPKNVTFETEEAGQNYVDGLTKDWPEQFKSKIPSRDKTAADRLRVVRIFNGAVEADLKQNVEEKRIAQAAPRQEMLSVGQKAQPQGGELEKRLNMSREAEPYDHRRIGGNS